MSHSNTEAGALMSVPALLLLNVTFLTHLSRKLFSILIYGAISEYKILNGFTGFDSQLKRDLIVL